MDDLAGKLNEILNNPAEMAKFQQMANNLLGQMNTEQQNALSNQRSNPHSNLKAIHRRLFSQLNLLGQQSAPAQTPQTNNTPLGALSSLGGLGNTLGALGGGNGVSPEMLNTVMKIAPLLGSINQEDDNTRLLHALRPLLKSERQKKLDEAIKIMRMLKFLPLLKEQGILQGIL
ncbi:MAG: hypothetical protein ACLSCV_12170, partial [Acutalibacteraceae bacterium]